MKPETEKLLAKASRAIDAAKLLLQAGDADFAAGRAYYVMFYVAEALLAEKGRRFRRHSAVQAAYGDEFAKPAVLDPQFHRWLLDASEKRVLGDYGVEAALTPDDVRAMLEHARALLAVLHRNTLRVTLAAGEAIIVEGFPPRVPHREPPWHHRSVPGSLAPLPGEYRVSQRGLEAGPLAHHAGDHDRPKQPITTGPDLSIEV